MKQWLKLNWLFDLRANKLSREELPLPLIRCPTGGAAKSKLIWKAFISLLPFILGRGDTFTKCISCLTCSTANLSISVVFKALGPEVSLSILWGTNTMLHTEMFLPSHCVNSGVYNPKQSLPLIIVLSWQCLPSWKSIKGLQVSMKLCGAGLGTRIACFQKWALAQQSQKMRRLEAWDQDLHGRTMLLILSGETSVWSDLSYWQRDYELLFLLGGWIFSAGFCWVTELILEETWKMLPFVVGHWKPGSVVHPTEFGCHCWNG